MIKSSRKPKAGEAEVVRKRISVTLPEECISWLQRQVDARKYYNLSHALESLILERMGAKREKGGSERGD